MAFQIKSSKQKEAERLARDELAISRLRSGQTRGDDFLKTPDAVDELYQRKGIEGRQDIPTEPAYMSDPSGAVDRAMTAGSELNPQPLIDTMAPVFDIETNQFTNNPEDKQRIAEEEAAFQAAAAPRIRQPEVDVETGEAMPATLDFESPAELKAKPEVQAIIASYDPENIQGTDKYGLNITRTALDVETDFEVLADAADTYNQIIPRTMLPTLTGNTEIDNKVQSTLSGLGLYDTDTGTLSTRLGAGLATAIAIEGKNVLDKEDTRITQRGKSFGSTDLSPSVDRRLDANEFRNRISQTLFDIIAENPIAQDSPDIRPGFGGGSASVSSDVIAATNAIFNNVLTETGMFSVIEQEGEPDYIAISDQGQAYIRSMQPLMEDMGFANEVDTSATPTIGGTAAPFRARERGRRKEGSQSKTNQSDPNTAKADLAKSILGSIPYRVMEDRFVFARMMVNNVIQIRQNQDGRQFVDIRGKAAEGDYSTQPYAKTMGLDKAKWLKARDHALKTMDEGQATAQANMVMRKEARKLSKIITQGLNKRNQVFYNKIMDATSVGRFFVRNTVLNPQDSKSLARMFVGSAQKTYLNPLKDRSTKTYENFLYITGRNLLTPTMIRDLTGREVDTEDMGWNSILNTTKKAMDGAEYDQWVAKGRKLIKIVNALKTDPQANLAGFLSADPSLQDLFNELNTKGEWGYAFQSYIDLANFDLASKQGRGQTQAVAAVLNEMGLPPDTKVTGSFTPEAQTQHDGKQNGIAIQAMQMGNADLLSRTGLIYASDDNVLPLGDVRKLFAQNLNQGIDYATKSGGLSDERREYWKNFFLKIEDNRELIKELSKQPLMEVSYGRHFLFNEETARSFIDNEEVSVMLDLEAYNYTRQEAINDLNYIIAGTIAPTLSFKHQSVYKKAGRTWALLGLVPEMQGPMGNNIYMGSTEYYDTGEVLTVDMGDELQEITIRKPRYTGSAQMRNRKLIFDAKTNKWTIQPGGRYGQEVANQLPVLPIQQIDAAIMAESVIQVNRAAFENKKGVKFLIPVHDAIITDVSSVDEYHRAMNRNFVEMNKRYSVTKAVYNGLNQAKSKAMSKINDNQMYELNDASIYRAVHDELRRMQTFTVEGKSKVISEDGILEETTGNTPNWMKDILRKATKGEGAYWNIDGTGSVSGKVLKQIINELIKRSEVLTELSALHRQAENNIARVFKDPLFKLDGSQYN